MESQLVNGNRSWPWWASSILFALGTAIIVAILLPIHFRSWQAIVAIAAAAFVFVWFRNPAARYLRLAGQILAFWVVSSGGSEVLLYLGVGSDTLAFSFANDTPWAYHIAMGIALSTAMYLDYSSREGSPLGKSLRSLIHISPTHQSFGENRGTQSAIGYVAGDVHIHAHAIPAEHDLDEALRGGGKSGTAAVRAGAFHDQIDAAAAFIRGEKIDVALELLQKLRQREWDKMNAREKYRTLANIGHCYNRREEFDDSLAYFEEALTYQPADPDAKALVASAYFSAGDDAEARRRAEEVLKESPNVATAHVVMLRTDSDDISSEAQLENLPTIVKRDVSVRLALGWRAVRRHEFSTAKQIAKQGKKDPQHSLDFEVLDAATTVSELSIRIIADPPAKKEEAELLEEAVNKLEEAEKELVHTPSRQQLGQLYYYLASANLLLANKSEAEYAFRQSIKAWPSATDVGRQFATFLFDHKRPNEAISVLEAEPHQKDAESCVLLAYHLAQRDSPGDRERAVVLLRRAISQEQVLELVHFCNAVNLLGQLNALGGDNEEVRQTIKTLNRGDLSEAHRLALEASTYRATGHREEAIERARNAAAALGESEDEIAYWDVANVCKACGLFNEALFAFLHFVEPTSRRSHLMEVLECADRAENSEVLLSFTKRLREEGVYLDEAIELEAYTRERFDDVDGTVEVLDQFLALGRDDYFTKLVKLRRAILGVKYSRPELQTVGLHELPSADEATPEIGKLVAAVLRAKGEADEALRYAYTLLRKNFASSDAHKGFVGAVGEPGHEASLPTYSEVQPGTAVHYEALVGDEKGWWILEDLPDAKQEIRELSLEHPIAKGLLGKSVGDEFVLRGSGAYETGAKILAIISKYQFRYKDIFDNWQDRFPDEFFVYKIEARNDEKGEPDLTPILKSLDEKAAYAEKLHDAYRSGPLSIASFAVMTGVDTIDAVMHLASQPSLEVRCCFGSDEEHADALACITASTRLVLCPSAIATLWATRAFEVLPSLPFRLVLTTAVIEQVRRKNEDKGYQASGFLAKVGEKYVYTKPDLEEAAKHDSAFSKFYEWLTASSDIETGLALAELPSTLRNNLTDIFGDEVAQAMAVAKKHALSIWTDDLGVAELSRAELKISRTWTEVVLTSSIATGRLGPDEYARLLAVLNAFGYKHTRLVPEAVLSAAMLAAWDPMSWPFPAVVEWCRNPNLNPFGVARVVGFALPLLWRASPLAEQAEGVSRALLQAVKELPEGDSMLRAISRNMDRFFGVDALNALKCQKIAESVLRRQPPGRWILPGDGGTEL